MICVVAIPVSASETCENRPTETYHILKDTSLTLTPNPPWSYICLKGVYPLPFHGVADTTFLTPGWESCPEVSSPTFVYTPTPGWTGYDRFGYEIYGRTSEGVYQCEFTHVYIYVENPAQTLQDLMTNIDGLGLPKGIEQGLLAKLDNAQVKIAQEHYTPARNTLNAFIHQVNAQRGKVLTTEQADDFIATAQRIIDAIPGK
jgi:hypothetical protein